MNAHTVNSPKEKEDEEGYIHSENTGVGRNIYCPFLHGNEDGDALGEVANDWKMGNERRRAKALGILLGEEPLPFQSV